MSSMVDQDMAKFTSQNPISANFDDTTKSPVLFEIAGQPVDMIDDYLYQVKKNSSMFLKSV